MTSSPAPAPACILTLEDVETGAELTITTLAGAEAARYGTTPAVDALFDPIVAAIRRQELPPDDAASVLAPAPEGMRTITCGGERDASRSGTSPPGRGPSLHRQRPAPGLRGSSTYTLAPVP